MAVFRVERNKGYTVMSNHHLRNKDLSLKAKGLLSQMLSLPEDWDYTLKGLSLINREQIDAIRAAIRELEQAGYIVRSRERDSQGRLRGADYVIYEQPQPVPDSPTLENPMLDIGRNPNRLGRGQYRFCPAGPDPFGGMCAEQGKPQRYQYRIHGNQRVLGAADGGNCCACHVPYFRSVRKLLCGKLEKLLDVV